VRSTGAEARRTGGSFDRESIGSNCRGCLDGNRGFLISGESIVARVGAITEAGNSHPNQMAKMLYDKRRTQLR